MRFAPTLQESLPSADVAGKHGAPLISNVRLLELYAAMVRMSVLDPAAANEWGAVLAAFLADLAAVDRIVYDLPDPATQLLADFVTPFRAPLIEAPPSLATGLALALARQNPGAVVLAMTTLDRLEPAALHEALRVAAREALPILYLLLPAAANHGAQSKTSTRLKTTASLKASGRQDATGLDATATAPSQEDWSRAATLDGVVTIPVDAADALALYRVAFEMIARARTGSGPTLIDCKKITFTAGEDDAIARMEAHLSRKGLLEAGDRAHMTEELLRAAGRVSRTAARRAGTR